MTSSTNNETALTVDPVSPAPTVRRAPTPRVVSNTRPRIPVAVWVIGALIIGSLLGGFLVRQRYRAKDVVGAINGVVIKQNMLYHTMEKTNGAGVMRMMVEDELTLQFAAKKGVSPTAAEVDKRYQKESQNPNFEQQIAASGLTEEDVKRKLQVGIAKANLVKQGMTVTDAEVHNFYNANIDPSKRDALYYKPESVQIAVIVTSSEAEARKANQDLNKGTSFGTVAANYSKDTSKDRGGVLPVLYRGRANFSKIPGIEATIYGMKIGQQIGPQKFANAWWIIHCEDRKPQEIQPFAKVEAECRDNALLLKGLQKNTKRVNEEFEAFRKASNVQMFWEQYKGVMHSPGQ